MNSGPEQLTELSSLLLGLHPIILFHRLHPQSFPSSFSSSSSLLTSHFLLLTHHPHSHSRPKPKLKYLRSASMHLHASLHHRLLPGLIAMSSPCGAVCDVHRRWAPCRTDLVVYESTQCNLSSNHHDYDHDHDHDRPSHRLWEVRLFLVSPKHESSDAHELLEERTMGKTWHSCDLLHLRLDLKPDRWNTVVVSNQFQIPILRIRGLRRD